MLALSLVFSAEVKARSTSEVELFGNKFRLPVGCVLYPRPSLIDSYIRFRCAETAESEALTIVFMQAERCDSEMNTSYQYQTLHQYSGYGASALIVVHELPEELGQLFLGKAFDEETCLVVTGSDFKLVNALVESALGK